MIDGGLTVIATLAAAMALVLQLAGHSGECAGGDPSTFVRGAWLSAPLLVLAGATMAILWARSRGRTDARRYAPVVMSVALVFALPFFVFMNAGLGFEVLVAGGSPCGPEFHDPENAYSWGNLALGAVYLLLPAALLTLAFLQAVLILAKPRASRDNNKARN